jgi:hypothetical protein
MVSVSQKGSWVAILDFDRKCLFEGDDPALVYKEPAVCSETHSIPRKRLASRPFDHHAFLVENTPMTGAFPLVAFGYPLIRAPEMGAYGGNHPDGIFFTHHEDPFIRKKLHTLRIIIYPANFKFFWGLIKDIGKHITSGGNCESSESSKGGNPAKVIQKISS